MYIPGGNLSGAGSYWYWNLQLLELVLGNACSVSWQIHGCKTLAIRTYLLAIEWLTL